MDELLIELNFQIKKLKEAISEKDKEIDSLKKEIEELKKMD